MLEKFIQAWQAHASLAVFLIIFGFILVSMLYKWRLATKKARASAAKAQADQAAKAASIEAKLKKQRFNAFTRWSFGVGIIVSLIFAIYYYLKPF